MKKNIKNIFTTLALVCILVLPFFVFASEADPLQKLRDTGTGQGPYQEVGGTNDVFALLGKITRAALSLLGVIFVALMIYGGYKYMLARGNEDEVKSAIGTIRTAIIGLILVLSAFSIWMFISRVFLD